jgi:hypothetical protein
MRAAVQPDDEIRAAEHADDGEGDEPAAASQLCAFCRAAAFRGSPV